MTDDSKHREDIYSKSVRAGKRTYFFDVKTTRGNDLYLTITESKRRYGDDGKFYYEKHKLFLYKEDFEKFADGLTDVVGKIRELQATGEYSTESPMDRSDDQKINDDNSGTEDNVESNDDAIESNEDEEKKTMETSEEFTDVSFEDLDD